MMQIVKIHFPTIDSTNTWAKLHIQEFDMSALTIITADEQTKGRGRFNRVWVAPKGCNLYVTYVLFIDRLDQSIGNFPQVLALAAQEAILHFPDLSVPIDLKWPNDLISSGKKIGGILCEIAPSGSMWGIIIGLGLNINMPLSLLQTIDRPATSLSNECGKPIDKDKLIEAIHVSAHTYLQKFLKEGFSPFLEPYRKALIHKEGDFLRLNHFNAIFEGNFQGIDEKGSLLLRLSDGTLKQCISGELF